MKIGGFDDAFTLLIGNEGTYSDNPADPGGETMWGITQRVARANGYDGAMRELPLEIAKTIAKRQYWDRYQCDQFNPEIAFQVFDAAYNGGHPSEWLQQAAGVTADGSIGAKTVAAVRSADARSIIMRFDAYRIRYLANLGVWPAFGKGWMNRIATNLIEGAD